MSRAPTAAVLIIGDEVLRGKVVDENSPFFAAQLRAMGVDLLRIVTIPDDLAVIAAAVAELSALADHLFTSGGVGPTHDDLTYEGVARAFDLPLVVAPEIEALLSARMGPRYNAAAQRMATIPAGSELWWAGDIPYPLVVTRNVAIFPGVPALLRARFAAVADRFTGQPMGTRRLVTTAGETDIAHLLTAAAARWPEVSIGSYPQFDQKPYTVTLTLDSRDAAALEACEAKLRADLAPQLLP